MKSFILVSLFIVCQTLACSEQKENVCNDYCDIKVVAAEQDAINKLCEVSDSNLELFGDKCDRTCGEILEYVVDPEEQKEEVKPEEGSIDFEERFLKSQESD